MFCNMYQQVPQCWLRLLTYFIRNSYMTCFPAPANQVLVSNSLNWLCFAFLVVVAVFTRGVRVTKLCQRSFWENSLRAAKTSATTV